MSETLDYILGLNKDKESIFCGKIDEEKIGITGYSQDGTGAIRAVTEFDNSNKYMNERLARPISDNFAQRD